MYKRKVNKNKKEDNFTLFTQIKCKKGSVELVFRQDLKILHEQSK